VAVVVALVEAHHHAVALAAELERRAQDRLVQMHALARGTTPAKREALGELIHPPPPVVGV